MSVHGGIVDLSGIEVLAVVDGLPPDDGGHRVRAVSVRYSSNVIRPSACSGARCPPAR
jgi:hypothetical protein